MMIRLLSLITIFIMWTAQAVDSSCTVQHLCDIQGLTSERIVCEARRIKHREEMIRKKRLLLIGGAMTLITAATASFLCSYSQGGSVQNNNHHSCSHYIYPFNYQDYSFGQEVLRGIRNGCVFGFYSAVGGIAYCLAREGYGALAQTFKECFFDWRDEELVFYGKAFEEYCAVLRTKITLCLRPNMENEEIIESAYSIPFSYDECIQVLGSIIGFCHYYTSKTEDEWGEKETVLYTRSLAEQVDLLQQYCFKLAELCSRGDALDEIRATAHLCHGRLYMIQEFITQKIREYRRDKHGALIT